MQAFSTTGRLPCDAARACKPSTRPTWALRPSHVRAQQPKADHKHARCACLASASPSDTGPLRHHEAEFLSLLRRKRQGRPPFARSRSGPSLKLACAIADGQASAPIWGCHKGDALHEHAVRGARAGLELSQRTN
jgi:hypothetical protein